MCVVHPVSLPAHHFLFISEQFFLKKPVIMAVQIATAKVLKKKANKCPCLQ
jgi:hypothetical protein